MIAQTGVPKRSLLGLYFRWAAIDGMTDPFFLEMIVNPDVLPVERPFVVAHEWAHLAGYAEESEANFVAWLTCAHGDARAQIQRMACALRAPEQRVAARGSPRAGRSARSGPATGSRRDQRPSPAIGASGAPRGARRLRLLPQSESRRARHRELRRGRPARAGGSIRPRVEAQNKGLLNRPGRYPDALFEPGHYKSGTCPLGVTGRKLPFGAGPRFAAGGQHEGDGSAQSGNASQIVAAGVLSGVKRMPVRAATRPARLTQRAQRVFATRPMLLQGSHDDDPEADSPTSPPQAVSSKTLLSCTESGHSSFRQPGKTSGSVPIREVIFRQRAATRADGSSIDIIPAGAKFATRRSTTA